MKAIVLRDYQKKAVNFCCNNLQSRGNSLLVAATGAGKTVMLGAVADYLVKNMGCKTVYVVVGRDKINRQNKETIRLCAPGIAVSEYSGRIKSLHGSIVCMTQQTANNHYMNLPAPDSVLIDECFVKGTKIATPFGEKNIEKIKVGDKVFCFNEKSKKIEIKKVEKTYKNPAKSIMCVNFGTQMIQCTTNHPFYTKRGWVQAKDLKENDYILQLVPKGNHKFNKTTKGLCSRKRLLLLLQRLWPCSISEKIIRNNGKNKSKIRIRSNARTQPYEAERARPEKNTSIEWVRVDSIKILESRNYGKFVYNFAVNKHHNYFANGILVHNCHHARAETYERLIKYWAPRFLFGATATPDRGDKKSLITLFDNFYQISTKQLIEMNYLCKPVFYPFKCNTYIKKDIITALSSLPLAPGKTIHFCRNHTMAKLLVEIIQGAGTACAYLADDKDNDPEYALFAGNSCNHLVNVDIATEGFDEPRIMNVVNWCSDGSRGRFVQKIGRGLRPAQNKTECRVFDCGGNIETYGDLEFTEILPEECVKLDGQKLCIADLFGAGGGFKKPISKDSIFEMGAKSMPYAPPAGWFSFYDNDFGVVFLTNGGSSAMFIKDNEKITVDISCQADFEIEDFTLPGTNKSNGEINRWQLNQLTDVPTFGFTAQQANAVLAWKQWKKRYTHGKQK